MRYQFDDSLGPSERQPAVTVDLHVRPVFHYNEQRARAHVFLCLLAYYVEWHMLKPMLFEDEEIEAASAARASAVAKAVRSEHAKAKDADDELPLHSFRTLLKDLGTLAYNVTHTSGTRRPRSS